MMKTSFRLMAWVCLATLPGMALAANAHKVNAGQRGPGDGPLPMSLTPKVFGPGDGPMPIKPCFSSPNPLVNGMPNSSSHCGHPKR